jgi:hypothetical protein
VKKPIIDGQNQTQFVMHYEWEVPMSRKWRKAVCIMVVWILVLMPSTVLAEMHLEGFRVGAMNYNSTSYTGDAPAKRYGIGFKFSFGGPKQYRPTTKLNGVDIKSMMPASMGAGLSVGTIVAISAVGLGVVIVVVDQHRKDSDEEKVRRSNATPPPHYPCGP